MEVVETGRTIVTDASGTYSFGSPQQNVTINANAFAYQDTSLSASLTLYNPDTIDIQLQPELEATIAGQVLNPATGTGIEAELEFFAEGNPRPGPYVTTSTDPNGNYSIQTIIGNYDIVVTPVIPYPVTELEDVALDPNGLNLNVEIDPADVMLVNDDMTPDDAIYYQESLDSIGISYFAWNVLQSGIPDTIAYNLFPQPRTVIWYTGSDTSDVLSNPEQESLAAHLDNGGRLLLTGQNIAETSSAGVLLTNYLEASSSQNYNPPILRGVQNDPIGDGLLVSTGGGAQNQNSKDILTIGSQPIVSFNYGPSGTSGIAGIRLENSSDNWKAVFLGFGLEGVDNNNGIRDAILQNTLTWFDVITGVEDQPVATSDNLPGEFSLSQNYPNPFNPATTIKFSIPERSEVNMKIFNTLGQEVRTLVQGRFDVGTHEVVWDGRDDSGNQVSSGIYLYRISVDNKFTDVKKLILLK